ncbi:hypothetical protein ON010_g10736 [Phytophthora cinnamomi]|nr:hypothetical protein ON010_g10736 [Phytophthora cinnamomi]
MVLPHSAIGNFFLNIRRTRENSTKPLIDWDVILVMQPLLLLGATCGTVLNTIMPTWLLSVLLVLVLSVTGTRTLQKAISARQKERWQCGVSPESSSLLSVDPSKTPTGEPQLRADVPWRKLATLLGLFVVIAGMRIVRGGQNFDSPLGIDASSALYPVLVALPYLVLVGVSYFSLTNLGVTYQKQQNPQYEPEAHEIKWTASSIGFFPAFSFAAGAVSGMFGIGGGIINAPLLLEVGIDPSAASAMTAATVLFSSGSKYPATCQNTASPCLKSHSCCDVASVVVQLPGDGEDGSAARAAHAAHGVPHDVHWPPVSAQGRAPLPVPKPDHLLHGRDRSHQRRRHERRECPSALRLISIYIFYNFNAKFTLVL